MREPVRNVGHGARNLMRIETQKERTSAISSSLSFFISVSFFSMPRKSVIPYSAQMRS